MKEIAAASEGDIALMCQQIAEQYPRSVAAMPEVLKLGAMAMRLRAFLISACGNKKLPRGRNSDGGLSALLAEHAPEVRLSVLYRFEEIAKAIALEYEQVVGKKIARQFSLPELVTTPAEKLPALAQAKQLELFDYVSGTSQRSWLDTIRPPKRVGGNQYERDGSKGLRYKPTTAELISNFRERCVAAGELVHLVTENSAFCVLNDADLDGLIAILDRAQSAAAAWRKKTKAEREQLRHELLDKFLSQ